MSLSSIKQKEVKGKKNVLPKLRSILANPYKQHSPVLRDSEVFEFRDIIKAAISKSNNTLKTFATQAHIHLGLESSLRAINGRRFSCVFISLSLRPSHLVRLIATSASVMVPTAPIYAQPKLEELTYELFGVRTLALVLPLDVDGISPELAKWVNFRKKTLAQHKPVAVPAKTVESRKLKSQLKKETTMKMQVTKETAEEPHIPQQNVEKQWSGDYISCTNDRAKIHVDQVDVLTEKQQLDAALSNLFLKTQSTAKATDHTLDLPAVEAVETMEPMEVETADNDDDKFLPPDLAEYKPLIIHQICANPDKKPKKKRNKNKKSNQNTNPPKSKAN